MLRDMNKTPASLALEVKAVAEFFEYKITKLLLVHQLHDYPNDAILQHQRHVKLFRNLVVSPEREPEHLGWMARQYLLFGELLDRTYMSGSQQQTTSAPLNHVGSRLR